MYPLVDGKPDYSQAIPCRCMRAELAERRRVHLMKMADLSPDFERFNLDKFRMRPGLEEAYNLAVDLAEERGPVKWLVLAGGTDKGKTHLAIGICLRWLSRGRPAKYGWVPLLLEELRRGFALEGDLSYAARFDFLLNVPLLVLDDLGTENKTPWVQEKLETIIDYRLIHNLPLVITTNKAMDELPVRIASRVQRVDFGRVLFIEASEYRLWVTENP